MLPKKSKLEIKRLIQLQDMLLKAFVIGKLSNTYTHYDGIKLIVNQMQLPIPEEDLNYLIDVLVFDGYVRKIENYQNHGYDIFSATVEGRIIYHKGGYKGLRNRKRITFNFEQVKSWAIVVGTVLAGLYGLNQMCCNKASASFVSNQFQPKEDSLSKYSYQILMFGSSIHQGSGFFIETNNDLAFVTAKHVVELCRNRDSNLVIKSAVIFLSDSEVLNIDPSRIRIVDTCIEDYFDYDVSMLFVGGKHKGKVNTVNKFLIPALKNWESVEFYGFPMSANRVEGGFLLKPPSYFYLDSSEFAISGYKNQYGLIDSTTAILKLNTNRDLSQMGGYSGSPVFIRERESGRARLMGVLSGSSSSNDSNAFIVVERIEEFAKISIQ
jgi:hypothetical protein